jgi:hypothetical protein
MSQAVSTAENSFAFLIGMPYNVIIAAVFCCNMGF